jgi:hypothetical protein
MLDHQKSRIVRKMKLSVSERQKSPIVKKNRRTAVKKPITQSAHSLLYLETELGSNWHEKLKDAGWKYVKGSDDVRASYKKDNDRIWVDEKWKWFYKNEKRTREIEWSTILKKFLS